jgi:serine/threonine-protein kinase
MNSPAPHTCPRCDTVNEARNKFCGHCGADMSGFATDDTQPQQARKRQRTRNEPAATVPELPRGRRSSDLRRDPWLGMVVDNRYRVIEVVGRGGMGVVYKVEHQRMSKIAAMKVLHEEYGNDGQVVERFHREAEAVSRLNHPNTVQVFDFGTTRGACYLIMEYVRGLNLGALVHRDGPMPFGRAAPLLMQVCAALTEAHELGVVHRDLKPENVLVTRTHRGRDFVKVLDFGLAKLSEREELADVSEQGAIVGTPYYMSPEQIRGEDVDARADIYSFGAMMYRLLTGEHPYEARTPVGVVTKHLTAALVPPSRRAPELRIHPKVEEVVVRCLAKERDDRYPSIGAVLDELENAFVEACAHITPLALSWSSLSESRPHRVAQLPLHDSGDQIDYGMLSSVRLQRADLDVFERSLRQRWWLRVALVPLVLAAVVGVAGYLLMLRAESPRTSEREPNNTFDQATLIAQGAQVTGYLGKRIDRFTPDQDYYRLNGQAQGENMSATVRVTGLPNMDVMVSLLDATGQVMWHADEGGMGAGEWVRWVRVRDGLRVLVTQSMGSGQPIENVSDPYTLSVLLEPASPDREIEPNDNPSDAVTLHPGKPVSGYLDRRGDVDSYRFEGPGGRYRLSIEGAGEVSLTWQVEDGTPSVERQATIELAPGQIIRLARSDRATPHDQSVPGVESPYTIGLVEVAEAAAR